MPTDTLVLVRSVSTAIVDTEDGPVAVMQLVCPSGDYRRFLLTRHQVDQLAAEFVGLSVDLATTRE